MTGAAGSFDKLLVAPVGRGNVSSTHGGTCDAGVVVGLDRAAGASGGGGDLVHGGRGRVSGGDDLRVGLHTTRTLLRQHNACHAGYRKLLTHLGGAAAWPDDKPIPLLTVLDSNGLADTLWCLRAVLPDEEAARDRIARLFAADCADAVLPIFERARPGDTRPREAIEAARQFARGSLDAKTLREKRAAAAADAAAYAAADAAADAAAAAAAYAAADAAAAAYAAAAYAAAAYAAADAAAAAYAAAAAAADAAAYAAADAAAAAAAYAAAREQQAAILRDYLTGARS